MKSSSTGVARPKIDTSTFTLPLIGVFLEDRGVSDLAIGLGFMASIAIYFLSLGLGNLLLLCSHHHRFVHEHGYRVTLDALQLPRFVDGQGRVVT